MSKKQIFIFILLASLFSASLSVFGYKLFVEDKQYRTIEEQQKVHFSNFFEDGKAVVPEGLNFVYAANFVNPAVVHVKTYYEMSSSSSPYHQQQPFDQFFREFFGDPYHGMPEGRGEGLSQKQQASGSGVILSADGYIVTNNHVIDNADKIEVVLNDKRSYTAELIGKDPTTDLAVLKIEESELPFVKFGNSDELQIGEWVLAVGNPFNLTSTVTAGIVSAKARNINILRDRENLAIESFIQTDAVVNPGNSGGALVNLKGDLVGINTAIATPTGTFAGYSFAVPAALVKKVVEDIKEFGTVQRALLGVTILDVTSDLVKEKGLSKIRGVYVASVREGSSAGKAGLKEGDVVTAINGVAVNSASELQELVARYRPGDKVNVTFFRKGDQQQIAAVLQNKLGETDFIKKEEASMNTALGAQLQKLPASEAKKLKVDGGVKVVKVGEGRLKKAGVKDGFVILSIDKRPVNDPVIVAQILENSEGAVLVEGTYPDGKKDYFAIAK